MGLPPGSPATRAEWTWSAVFMEAPNPCFVPASLICDLLSVHGACQLLGVEGEVFYQPGNSDNVRATVAMTPSLSSPCARSKSPCEQLPQVSHDRLVRALGRKELPGFPESKGDYALSWSSTTL